MNKLKRKIISAITAFAFICSMGINTAQAATRLTTAHLYYWAKTANIVRLTQFQRYINLPDKNNNTALCLAQQAKNRNAYKLLLEYGASTDVECHNDDDPVCAIVAGDKVKVSPLGWIALGAGALVGAYIAFDDDGGKTPASHCRSENGEYPTQSQCENQNPGYHCEENINECYVTNEPRSCPANYSTDYQTVSDCGKEGGWILETNGKSGEETCGKCTAKTCNQHDANSSINYTSPASCPTSTGTKATSTTIVGYAGNNACYKCNYSCDTDNGYLDTCPDGMSCTPKTSNGVTCQTNPVCPTDHPYTDEATCEAGGYECSESAPGTGCWKHDKATPCEDGYSTNYQTISDCGQEGGWTFDTNGQSGGKTCGKCTAKTCTTGSTTPCTDYANTTPTQSITGYSGDNACYSCTYSCDETTYHYDQSNTCETKHAGFDCKSKTVEPSTTCFVVDKCETDYLSSCESGSFYTATASQTYTHPTTGATCNTCEYSCDVANGWSTTTPAEGVIKEQFMPNGSPCYTSTNCPTDYPYTKAQCEANGHGCEASTDAPNCYKPTSCPITPYAYQENLKSCNNTSGWTYHSKNLGSLVCGYCKKENCPTGETTQCSPEETGAKLTPTPTANYEGDTQCYTCTYACDETTTFANLSTCKNNGNYICSETNPNGLTCWKRTSDGECPTGTSETQCSAEEGYTFTQTEQTIGDNKKCYSCSYACDESKNYLKTCPDGMSCTPKTFNGVTCQTNPVCPTDHPYTDEATCETGGYTCTESATGTGCWKRGEPSSCPTGYDTKYQTAQNCATEYGGNATGWTVSTSGQSGGVNCGKCVEKSCPASYPNTYTSADACPTTGTNGYTLNKTSNIYSGNKLCTKCDAKTCRDYDIYSSTSYTTTSACPTVSYLTADDVNPVSQTAYAGENICNICSYTCDDINAFNDVDMCIDRNDTCEPRSFNDGFGHNITCYVASNCPNDYISTTECDAQGYTCTPHPSIVGCSKPTACPTGFTKDLANCSAETYPSGWTYSSQSIDGLITCGKCTAKTCSTGTTTCQPADTGYTLTETPNGTYAGNDACLTCTYDCNETTHFDTCPAGKDCSTDTQHGVTCQITPVCKEGYTFDNEATCEAGGYTCTESATGSGCWKRTGSNDCPTGYTKDLTICSSTHPEGWTHESLQVGDNICGKCTAKTCTTGTLTCTAAANGYKLTSTGNGTYAGNDECLTCNYACDESKNYLYTCPDGMSCKPETFNGVTCQTNPVCKEGYTFDNEATCEAGGYTCTESATGSGCWKRGEPSSCPTGYDTKYQTAQNCATEYGGNATGWTVSTSGQSGGVNCGKCNPVDCNSGYTAGLTADQCFTQGTNGWTVTQDTVQPYSGTKKCNTCTELQCSRFDDSSSTSYQSINQCPSVTGLTAFGLNPSGYQGDTICNTCSYKCNDTNYYEETECENIVGEGQICTPITITTPFGESVTCYQPSTCPTNAPYSNIQTCQANGHTCAPSATEGCYKPASCPTGFDQNRTDCSDQTYPSGWTYSSQSIDGLITCGKCTAIASCDIASAGSVSSLSQCQTITNLDATLSGAVAYAGNTACYNCEYSCDEDNHFYDNPSECSSTETGFTCSSTNVGSKTCYTTTGCDTTNDYQTASCTNGTGYTASTTFNKTTNGITCNKCSYSCDDANGWSTTDPLGFDKDTVTAPDGTICYLNKGCPAGTYDNSADCSQNAWHCKESAAATKCWERGEPWSCNVTGDTKYQTQEDCVNEYGGNNSGWRIDYVSMSGNEKCNKCTALSCPRNEYTTCPASDVTGIISDTPTETGNFSGAEKCLSCNYKCDTTSGYTSNNCASNTGYIGSAINNQTYTSAQGTTTSCHQCEYTCDTANGWSTIPPAEGRDTDDKTLPDGTTVCYKDAGCPIDTYTEKSICEQANTGYTCKENVSGSNCWIKDIPAACPTGYDTKYQTAQNCATEYGGNATGWSVTFNGQSGGVNCGKCVENSCPASYPNTYTSADACPTKGTNGYTLDKTSNIYSGNKLCTKCDAKTCSTYNPNSSTSYTTTSACPTVSYLTADDVNPVSGTSYAGELLCYICSYTCDDINAFNDVDMCIDRKGSCKLAGFNDPFGNSVACYVASDCPDGTIETTMCNSQGYSCTPSNDVAGCSVPACPTGYTEGLTSCSNKANPEGWNYTSLTIDGVITCGRCTAIASCEIAYSGSVSSLSQCQTITNLDTTLSGAVAYAGDTACYNCTYSCDEDNHYYDISSDCSSTETGFTCSSTNVGSKTCYTTTGCDTTKGYQAASCTNGTGYTASTTFNKTTNGITCNKCSYSCDAANGYINEGNKVTGREYSAHPTPDANLTCYKDIGCPANYPIEGEENCTAGGYECLESAQNTDCWVQVNPTPCPAGTKILSECPAPNSGFKTNHITTDSYSGGKQCHYCEYQCNNEAGYYGNETTCLDNNPGYMCKKTTQFNSDGTGTSCWYKSENDVTTCPTNTYTECPTNLPGAILFASSEGTGEYSGDKECLKCFYKCNSDAGYQTEDCTITGTGYIAENVDNQSTTYDYDKVLSCHTCSYSCDVENGYSKTPPQNSGYREYVSDKRDELDFRCYKPIDCEDNGMYTGEQACLNAGYTECEESPISVNCYRPNSCPIGYSTDYQTVSDCGQGGWTFETNGTFNGQACGKCVAKTCNDDFTPGLTGNKCGDGTTGWTVAQDTVTPYAGNQACNKCVPKLCPKETILGDNCPTVTGLTVVSNSSNAKSGNDYCYSCDYSCDIVKGYYDDADLCDGDCKNILFITPVAGYTISCYTAENTQSTIENDRYVTINETLNGGSQDVDNHGTIKITGNGETTYGIKTTSGNIANGAQPGVIDGRNPNGTHYSIYSDTGNVTNYGELITSGDEFASIGIWTGGKIYNRSTGYIKANATNVAHGIHSTSNEIVHNNGYIKASSSKGDAAGILGVNVLNEKNGRIIAEAKNGWAYGIFISNGQVENYGSISVTGKNAYGIYASGNNNTVINWDGATIDVTGTNEAYGIFFERESSNNLVANYGTIIVNGEKVGDAGIYIDNPGIYLNGATLANAGDVTFQTEIANLDDLGGIVTLEDGGTYEAKSLKGNLTAGTSLVTGSNLDTYVAEDSLKVDNTDELNLTSGSAMFKASIEENETTGNKNVVMTRSSFDKFAPNASIANYLEENYKDNKLVNMFDKMKTQTSTTATSEAIAKELGYDIMPNFADENFTVLKSLNRNISETILTPTDEVNRVTAGYDNINIETKDKGLLSGSDLSSNTMYTFGDKRLDNKNRLGLGLSFTKISSNYEKGGNRDLEIISIFMPYLHKFTEKLRLSSILSFGMGFGEYDRGSSEYESDINDIFYGITNELRYSMDLNGFAELEPALMLNAIGYTEDGFDEGNGEKSLESQKTHNLSVEAGIGLFIKKQFNTPQHGRFTMRVGGAYYRELASPFDNIKARHKSGNGAWYKINDYADLYDEDRALLEATLNYDYKALGLYLKYNRLFQRNDPQLFDLGVKYNF